MYKVAIKYKLFISFHLEEIKDLPKANFSASKDDNEYLTDPEINSYIICICMNREIYVKENKQDEGHCRPKSRVYWCQKMCI